MFMPRVVAAAIASFLMLVVSMSVVRAGDSASRFVFGFSSDARWFAFEEFGVQDGSGFPYSNIFVIDTKRDRWAPGTPIRVRIDDENTKPSEASRRARAMAGPKLSKYGIDIPGRLLFSRPLSEVESSKRPVVYQPGYPYGSTYTLSIETFEGNKSSRCYSEDRPFGLILKGGETDGTKHILYRDASVPKSRGCPLRYAIADVIEPPAGASFGAMVLLYVFTIGFEGNDARFIAVPVSIPAKP